MNNLFNFKKAIELLEINTPFILFKPDNISFDITIPLLSQATKLPLVKIGVHNLGRVIRESDALHLIKSFVDFDQGTNLLWVEDISGVDDKESLIRHISECSKYNRVVFTGIEKYCKDVVGIIPHINWDINGTRPQIPFTYILPNQCQTVIVSPQNLHFRVYSNMLSNLFREFKQPPPILLENKYNISAPINSIILVSSLCINKGDLVNIITGGNYATHSIVVDCIKSGLSKPVSEIERFIHE